MGQLEQVTGLLICIFEVYIFYDFHKEIFNYRFQRNWSHLLILLGLTLSLFTLNQAGSSILNLCCTPLLLLIFSFLLYHDSYKRQILHVVIYFVISAGAEVVSEIIFSVVFTVSHTEFILDPYNLFFIIFFEKLAALLILRLVKSHSHKTGYSIDSKVYKWVFVLPATTLLLFIGFAHSEINIGVLSVPKVILVVGCFLLLCSNALVFYLFEKTSQIMYEASETKMQNMKLSMEGKHYDRIEEINHEHKKYLHDIHHYLGTISGLITQQKNEEALQVLAQMNQEFINIDKMEYCSYPILNAILCEKESIAKQKDIRYEVNVSPSVNLSHISDYDLIAMVGNLIDNAIEATEKVLENKYVAVDIFDVENSHGVMIRVENTFVSVKQNADGTLLTSKKDKEKHGIGLQSVKETVRKYDGFLTFSTDNRIFVVTLKI